MKFLKVPSEYRMISDEGNYELFLLSTGRDADSHFRLISPLQKLDFDAISILEPVPEWQVYRIICYARESTADLSNELAGFTDQVVYGIIEQALSDFGYFFGNKAGHFGVRFVTAQIYRSY
jgi:hypothetical protein